MAGRLTGVHAKTGDVNASPAQRDLAKKLLGYMEGQHRMGGPSTFAMMRALPDGSRVVAKLVNGQPRAEFYPPGEGDDVPGDTIYCYVSSPGGLRIFDLKRKKLAKTLTGLQEFSVDAVSRDGRIVYMTQAGGYQAARVDTKAITAFGANFRVDVYATGILTETNVELGYANGLGLQASPDGERLLVHFERGTKGDGTVTDGVGGYVLARTDTLAPLRGAIRMTHEQAPCAWRGDSERFYLGTTVADDGALTTGRLMAVTESTADYVAVFDHEGVLLGSRQLAAWDFTPDSGWRRRVIALAARGNKWLAALVDTGTQLTPVYTLHLLDAQDDALPTVSTLVIPGAPALSMVFSRSGARISLVNSGRVVEVAIDGDGAMELVHDLTQPTFAAVLQSRAWIAPPIENRPGDGDLPPRSWQFFLTSAPGGIKVLRAYNGGFDNLPAYQYDLGGLGGLPMDHRYRLASIAARPTRKTA